MTEHNFELFSRIFNYNPETGEITRAIDAGSQKQGSSPGRLDKDGYTKINVYRKTFRAHRIAWLLHYGKWPDGQIDHIDGDVTNNRISNLRDTDKSGNGKNMKRCRTNTSGCTGITWNKSAGCWQAIIRSRGEIIYLGCFRSKFDAAAVRKSAEMLHGFHPNHGRS